MKKGKITPTELACIKGMVADNLSVMDMANQLDRSSSMIEKEIKRIKEESVREQLFINKTTSGNQGVSIITEAASVRGDIASQQSTPTKAANGRSPWIHKINSDG